MIYEFLSTIELKWDDQGVCGREVCTNWKFRLGNEDFEINQRQLLQILLPPDLYEYEEDEPLAEPMQYDDNQRHKWWRKMTGRGDAYWFGKTKESMMKSRTWTLIHRIIALGIHERHEGAYYMNKLDTNVMMRISEDVARVDLMELFGRQIEEYFDDSNQTKHVGLGFIVTTLAKHLKFDLPEDRGIKCELLIEKKLVSMQLRNAKGEWNEPKGPTKTVLDSENEARKKTGAIPPDSPPTSQQNAPPASTPIPEPIEEEVHPVDDQPQPQPEIPVPASALDDLKQFIVDQLAAQEQRNVERYKALEEQVGAQYKALDELVRFESKEMQLRFRWMREKIFQKLDEAGPSSAHPRKRVKTEPVSDEEQGDGEDQN